MRKFIHIDMDAFFVSVEIRDNPTLLQLPVAVGGQSNQRGVITTCNYIARQFGVHSAMPTHTAKNLCRDLVIIPSRMQLYRKISKQIEQILRSYSRHVEMVSIDEAYLDVTDCPSFSGSATLMAQNIRNMIFQQTGLTASAGIAPLKFLAKIASDYNKPNGQYVIKPDHVIPFIDQLDLKKIPGVGPVTYEKLNKFGYFVGADIRRSDLYTFTQQFGRYGVSLWNKCQGSDHQTIAQDRRRKSLAIERTFSNNVVDLNVLKTFIEKELHEGLKVRIDKSQEMHNIDKAGVKLKFSDFRQTTKEAKCSSISLPLLYQLLEEAWLRRNGKSVRLLGIFVGLKDTESNQLCLTFD